MLGSLVLVLTLGLLGQASAATAPILALDLSADGRLVAVARARAVEVFDADTGERLACLGGHDHPVESVRFSPDGHLLAAGSLGVVTLWRRLEGDPAASAPTPSRPWSDWLRLDGHEGRVLALDFHPDGTLLAVGSGEPTQSGDLTIWETGKGLLVRRLDGLHSDTLCGLRFRPDGRRLATASADRFLKILDVSDGQELRALEGHEGHVLTVDWNTEGTQLFSGGADGAIKVWDAEAGELLRGSTTPIGQVAAVRWTRDDARNPFVAGACGDGRVRLWNPATAGTNRELEAADDFLYAVALSADRSRIVAAGARGILHVWDGTGDRQHRQIEAPADSP